jgi:hypothetical protein
MVTPSAFRVVAAALIVASAALGQIALRPVRVEGRLLDERRRPVSGAQVGGYVHGGSGGSAVTGPDGKFSVEAKVRESLIRAEHEISLHAVLGPRAAVKKIRSDLWGADEPMILVPAATLRVRAESDGRPLAGARVAVTATECFGSDVMLEPRETGSDGVATFADIPFGKISLMGVTQDGLTASATLEWSPEAGLPFALELVKGRALTVSVVERPRGKPVPGARLASIQSVAGGRFQRSFMTWDAPPPTNGDGKTTLAGVPSAMVFLMNAEAPGYAQVNDAMGIDSSATEAVIKVDPLRTVRWPIARGEFAETPAPGPVAVEVLKGDSSPRARIEGDALVVDGLYPREKTLLLIKAGDLLAIAGTRGSEDDFGRPGTPSEPVRFTRPRTLTVKATMNGAAIAGLELRPALRIEKGRSPFPFPGFGAEWPLFLGASIKTDAGGRAELGNLPACTASVLAEPSTTNVGNVRFDRVLGLADLRRESASIEVALAPLFHVEVAFKIAGEARLPSRFDFAINGGTAERTSEDPETGILRLDVRPGLEARELRLHLQPEEFEWVERTLPVKKTRIEVDLKPKRPGAPPFGPPEEPVVADESRPAPESRRRDRNILPDDTLVRLQVFDQANQPCAGVPVAIVIRDHDVVLPSFMVDWRSTCKLDVPPLRVEGTTGTSGIAALDLQTIALGLNIASAPGSKLNAVALLDLPVKDPAIGGFDVSDPPDLTLKRVLPKTGALALRVSGEAASEVDLIWLGLLPYGGGMDQAPLRSFWAVVKDGEATFPRVGLGLRFRAWASVGASKQAWLWEGAGPASEGERVTASLSPAEGPIVVTGVAQTANKRPLRRMSLEVWTDQRPHLLPWPRKVGRFTFQERKLVTTDENGRFEIEFPASPLETTFDFALLVTPKSPLGFQWPEPLAAEVLYPARTPAPGRLDLGEVVLTKPPVIARGRVVDRSGRPLAGARVDLECQIPTVLGYPLPDPVATELAEQLPWAKHGECRAFTDQDGKFVLRAPCAHGGHRLRATKTGWYETTLTRFEGEESGQTLELAEGAGLECRLLLDDGVPREALAVSVHETEPGLEGSEIPFEAWPDTDRRPLADGRVVFHGLWPSAYDLKVKLNGEVVARVTGLELVAGRTTQIPPIDLRGHFKVLRLQVRDENGAPLAGVEVSHGRSARARIVGQTFQTGPDGRVAIATEADSFGRVAFEHPGYRPLELKDPVADTVVTLRPQLKIKLLLDPPDALPLPPLALKAVAHPVGRAKRHVNTGAAFNQAGRATSEIKDPGDYDVALYVVKYGYDSVDSAEVPIKNAVPIEVSDSRPTPPLTLHVDPADVKAAALKLSK